MALDLMGSLGKELDKKGVGGRIDDSISFSSGFDRFDFMNGAETEEGDLVVGVPLGKMISIIGKSGTAKTALAVQMAWEIVKPFDNGGVFHIDFERSTKMERIQGLTKATKADLDKKYRHMNDGTINSEFLYELVRQIAKMKKDNREVLTTEMETVDGRKVKAMEPTVIIVDSVATMIPGKMTEEEELSGQMSASAIAKQNNAIIKRIPGDLIEANIIIIFINHITTKISINPMKPVSADINYLKPEESCPGGTAYLYLCDTLIRAKAGKKLVPEKEFGIKGFLIEQEFIKSRTNAAGRSFDMVFSQTQGFDNDLTNFLVLKEAGLVNGAGASYHLAGLDSVKFSQKTFKDKLAKHPELRDHFDQMVGVELAKCVGELEINRQLADPAEIPDE